MCPGKNKIKPKFKKKIKRNIVKRNGNGKPKRIYDNVPYEVVGGEFNPHAGEEVVEAESTHVRCDKNLLEKARTQWQFGEWESLAKLDRDSLQHHPDRTELLLLAAAGRMQLGDAGQAGYIVRLALDRGCSKKRVSQILISGVYNSLGRAYAIAGQQSRALQHFENAVAIGTPGGDDRLLTKERISEQFRKIDLLNTKVGVLLDLENSPWKIQDTTNSGDKVNFYYET